jgi:hypothetical protein
VSIEPGVGENEGISLPNSINYDPLTTLAPLIVEARVSLRERTFGLSVEGSTAAANEVGLTFEDTVGRFEAYLIDNYPNQYIFTKSIDKLPRPDANSLRQFFALSSKELKASRPKNPKFGEIYLDEHSGIAKIFADDGHWKDALEGIAPDRVLFDRKTNKMVLIEAKYGDTEGNAHIERAGARATPSFLEKIQTLFQGRASYLYIFSGPMVTARSGGFGPKIGKRGRRKGQVVQSVEKRVFASARYQRQIEVLFNGPGTWTMLWKDDGHEQLINLFESELRLWLSTKDR